ncbi:MAG TPA: hypothetical protein HPP97_02725 [Desulfuromonadales bacterium]|nr:hypothetical protein [Desulfuromonadales bacterium]
MTDEEELERHKALQNLDFTDWYNVDDFANKYQYSRRDALREIKRFFIETGREEIWEEVWRRTIGNPNYLQLSPQDIALYEKTYSTKQKVTSPQQHPCLNPEHTFYSEELSLALKAWEYAASKASGKTNYGAKVDAYLDKHNVGEKQRERIKSVCNPFKRGPRPASKK